MESFLVIQRPTTWFMALVEFPAGAGLVVQEVDSQKPMQRFESPPRPRVR